MANTFPSVQSPSTSLPPVILFKFVCTCSGRAAAPLQHALIDVRSNFFKSRKIIDRGVHRRHAGKNRGTMFVRRFEDAGQIARIGHKDHRRAFVNSGVEHTVMPKL